MHLIRIGAAGAERPAVQAGDGTTYDLTGLTDDITGGFLADGGIERTARALDDARLTPLDIGGLRVGPPIARPGKILCIGLNYRDHAAESGLPVPDEPIVFMKAPNTVVGPNDDVLIPRGSSKTDWEVELGVIIGSEARYLDSPDAASRVIAGSSKTGAVRA